MRRLADPADGDPPIVAGESGGTGLAGFLACNADPAADAHLGLGPASRILVFNSEGATDPAIYAQIVGRTPEEVVGDERRSDRTAEALVAINSVNPDLVPGGAGEAAIADFCAAWLAERGFEVHRLEEHAGPAVDRRHRTGSGGGRSLMFNGHIDTVSHRRL